VRLRPAGAAGREHDRRRVIGGYLRNVEAIRGSQWPRRNHHRRQAGRQLVVIRETARIGMGGKNLAHDAGRPARRQQIRLARDERRGEPEHEIQAVFAQIQHVALARELAGKLPRCGAEARRG
jgi:hypothetical protein